MCTRRVHCATWTNQGFSSFLWLIHTAVYLLKPLIGPDFHYLPSDWSSVSLFPLWLVLSFIASSLIGPQFYYLPTDWSLVSLFPLWLVLSFIVSSLIGPQFHYFNSDWSSILFLAFLLVLNFNTCLLLTQSVICQTFDLLLSYWSKALFLVDSFDCFSVISHQVNP